MAAVNDLFRAYVEGSNAMSWVTLDLFVSGLALLLAGAMVLVQGASGLATIAGVSPLAIGLTVVAFGTSTPELAITVLASHAGQPDIALGLSDRRRARRARHRRGQRDRQQYLYI